VKRNLHRIRNSKRRNIVALGLILVGLVVLGLVLAQPERPAQPVSKAALVPIGKKAAPTPPLDSSAGFKIRGVYLPAAVAANPKKLQEIVENSRRVGFTALVIDIKDNHGTVAYETKVPLAQQIGARVNILKLDELLPKLKRLGFYLIQARAVSERAAYRERAAALGLPG
jgi:uncharacterized lipoprotein YddW (UPF0748 family)